MTRIKLLITAVVVALGAVVLTATTSTAQGVWDDSDLVAQQRANWGLADFGNSNVVADFSSLGWALEENNNLVYAGGNFLNVTNGTRTESQPYLAAFDLRTGIWNDSFTPNVGGPVLSLENDSDGNMFVGGEMKTWNGSNVGGLIKMDPATGDIDNSFRGRVYGDASVVRDMHIGTDGYLYVVGSFNRANDGGNAIVVQDAVRFKLSDGSLDRNWKPNIDTFAGLWGVAASQTNNNVYLAGRSTNSGSNKGLLAVSKTNSATITWSGFAVNSSAYQMYDVEALPNGKVFIVGTEHALYIHDENQNMQLVRQHTTNYHRDYGTRSRTGGDGQELEVIDNTVYATCHCWGSHVTSSTVLPLPRDTWAANGYSIHWIGGTYTGQVSGVISYDADTGQRNQAFNPYMAGDVGGWAVLPASDGCLWITGGFNSVGEIGSTAPGRDLVRLCDEDGGELTIPRPASCEAVISGETVTVTWASANGVDDYVISRRADGGNLSWRGVSAGTTFVDTNRDAELVYSVQSRISRDKSSSRVCTTSEAEPEPSAIPTNCTFQVAGSSINVNWTNATDATKHVVYRSVNGSRQFWRGAVEGGNSFVDTNRDASLEYFVLAVFADNSRSERVPCVEGDPGPPAPEPDTVTPVSSCAATIVNGNARVTWPAVADAGAEYIVSRSVDGGNVWWRGRVSTTVFTDSLRNGSIEYFVQTKVGNDRSDQVACTPTLEG